jgi:quinol monooxygenase YgiN
VDTIQVAAIFPNITSEKRDDFKKIAAETLPPCAEDPGTLQFDWFFNADETRCVVRETYQNSEAVLNHLGLVGHMIPALIEAGGGIEVHMFGNPSEQLMEALSAIQPTYYRYFQGK